MSRNAHREQGPGLIERIRVYLEAVVAVALMAVMGIISAFVAAGVTGDSATSVPVAVGTFILTGVFLIYRRWRTLRRAARVRLD